MGLAQVMDHIIRVVPEVLEHVLLVSDGFTDLFLEGLGVVLELFIDFSGVRKMGELIECLGFPVALLLSTRVIRVLHFLKEVRVTVGLRVRFDAIQGLL